MGIRYFAHAFDVDAARRDTARLIEILSADPLGSLSLLAHLADHDPHDHLDLDLDKAWSGLQAMTRELRDAGRGGASLRMFDGQVTMTGWGWRPWVSAVLPEEVAEIRDDLRSLDELHIRRFVQTSPGPHGPEGEYEYLLWHLRKARAFVEALAEDGRGMLYTIG